MENSPPPSDYVMSSVPKHDPEVVLDEQGTSVKIEGATLNLDTASVEPVELSAPVEQPQVRLTREKFLAVIRQMVASEQITRSQAVEMRHRFGISNSSFHAKKKDKSKKKAARKLAKVKRRINALNGSAKGQKRNNGKG